MEGFMLLSKSRFTPVLRILIYCALGGLFILALLLRVALLPIETTDYTFFLSQWYDFIQSHGGFAALQYNFSNYNISYLSLLTVVTYLPIPKIIAIKSISIIFDGVLGLFTYLLLNLRYRGSYAAIIGALVVLFAPTIFINSSAWGQSDSIYAAFCLGSLYFLLKERPGWACAFFGLAIAFKLQAIFFFPVLLMLLLRRKLAVKYLLFIPAIFLVTLVPAILAGRDAWSVLTIYAEQVSNGGVGGTVPMVNQGMGRFNNQGSNQFPGGGPGFFNGGNGGEREFGNPNFSSSSLTLNAPSFYQWLPTDAPDSWKWLGIGLAAFVVILVGVLLLKSKQQITPAIILKIALVFALAIPFLLPEMHERYFYLADVLSIIVAFSFPRLFYIAVLMQLSSLLSYAPYLMNIQTLDLTYAATAVFAMTIVALVDLILTLYPGLWKREINPKSA